MKLELKGTAGRTTHEVGKVYRSFETYYLVARDNKFRYFFVRLGSKPDVDDEAIIQQESYNSLEEMDNDNMNDVLVDSKIVITE